MLINTGKLVYQWLRQIDQATGLPTGLRKPNDPGDLDYVPPVDSPGYCPIPYSWEPLDPYCVKTSEADSNNTGYKGWRNRRRLLANIPDGFVEPNLQWEGSGTWFPPVYDDVSCPIVVTQLQAFDYCVLTFGFQDYDGVNLQTFAGGIKTGTQLDTRWAGVTPSYSDFPYNSPPQDAYYSWRKDMYGRERLLLNFKSIAMLETTAATTDIGIRTMWEICRMGDFDMRVRTYLGGTMMDNNGEFQNTGGTLVQDITLSANGTKMGTYPRYNSSEDAAMFRYNRSTKQATLQIL
ncbi:hypothetical protein [Chitinophaga arvensicola]|uniref:Uncharacterized protein n=1 Tax=Chitinophaga arvensicola TaxID=29529 RepID=A0A1I0RA92_9BACT|nr:hypothetical protein [Chitinophaga arvensicola]SEW37532.1 hypothetical protein SAMN04488122_2517 [Chitinophaga arvensicola]